MRVPWQEAIWFKLGLSTALLPLLDDYLTLTESGRRMFNRIPKRFQPAARKGLRGANLLGGAGKVAIVADQYYGLQSSNHPLNRLSSKSSAKMREAYQHGLWSAPGWATSTPAQRGLIGYNRSMSPMPAPFVSGGVVYMP